MMKAVKKAFGFLLAVSLCVMSVETAWAQGQTVSQILYFEQDGPIYEMTAEPGTPAESLALPGSLRAVAALPDGMDVSTFAQVQPDVISVPEYTAPEDAETRYANGELVIYTVSVDGTIPEGTEPEYRVYGAVGQGENMWFACDAQGSLTGVIVDVPVTAWDDSGSYDAQTPGSYTFTAVIDTYTYSEAPPFAVVTLGDAVAAANESVPNSVPQTGPVCICGMGEDAPGEVHTPDCPLYALPAQTTEDPAASDGQTVQEREPVDGTASQNEEVVWPKEEKNSVWPAVIIIAATAAILTGAVFGVYWWRKSRRAHRELEELDQMMQDLLG